MLETQMSLAVAGTLISQDPMATCRGPLLGGTPIHTVQRTLTTFPYALLLKSRSSLYINLNLGAVQKFRNVWDHLWVDPASDRAGDACGVAPDVSES
jgi:hypothetical protein